MNETTFYIIAIIAALGMLAVGLFYKPRAI